MANEIKKEGIAKLFRFYSGGDVKQFRGQVEPYQLGKAHLAQDKHVPASAAAQIEQGLIPRRI